jgi:hypothetical protein
MDRRGRNHILLSGYKSGFIVFRRSECLAHEHPNLLVVGASVFPTSGTANPTLTAAALALRATDHAKSLMRKFP